MKRLALVGLLVIGGCSQRESPPLPFDAAQAATEVQSWVPLGTSVADAERIMSQHVFDCWRMTNSAFAEYSNVDLLYCDKGTLIESRVSRFTAAAEQHWQVALVLQSNKVSAIRANTKYIVH